MVRAEKTVVINRSVASVFDFLLNGASNKLWRSSVTDVQPMSRPPYGVGSKFRQGIRGPGGRMEGDYEITRCEPRELIEFQVTAGPARPKGTYTFRAQQEQTELTLTLELPADGTAKRMEPGVSRALFQDAVRDNGLQDAAGLSIAEKGVLRRASQARSEQEIAKSMSLGEGTIHNMIFSVYTKLTSAAMQRELEAEVGMLDELKAFLEKHA